MKYKPSDEQQNIAADLNPSSSNDNHIDIEEIYTVAKLARLGIDEQTAKDYADDISKILEMMQTIADVDTEGLKPLSNVHEVAHVLRADIPDHDINREQNQSVAPLVDQGLYLVPQVID